MVQLCEIQGSCFGRMEWRSVQGDGCLAACEKLFLETDGFAAFN